MRKLYSKVYSICENLVLKFKQSQAIQGIWKILVSFRPSAPFRKQRLSAVLLKALFLF